MKKMIFGLAVCSVVWTLLQIQSFNSALYLFIVLGLNPFNNKPVSTSTVFLSLVSFGLCMGILIFNREINILINVLLRWVKNPDDTVLSVELEPLNEPRKLSFSYKPKLPVISISKAFKLRRTPSVKLNLKSQIRPKRAELYKYLPSGQSIKNLVGEIHTSIRQVALVLINLSLTLLKSVYRAIHMSYRFVKATLIMLLIGLGLIELYILKNIRRLLIAAYLKVKIIILTVCAIARDLVIYVLVLGGYSLLISILLGFIIWRLCEPYARALDQWISEKVHKNEQVLHFLSLFREMFATFSSFYRELKALRRSLYR